MVLGFARILIVRLPVRALVAGGILEVSRSVFGSNDGHRDPAIRRGTSCNLRANRTINRRIDFCETNENVSMASFRVGPCTLEGSLDPVHSIREIAGAFDSCESGYDQDHQQRDDADDDEQFEQRKSASALTLPRQGECAPTLKR